MKETISIYLATQFSDIIAIDEQFPMQNYVYPIIKNKDTSKYMEDFKSELYHIGAILKIPEHSISTMCKAVLDNNYNRPDSSIFNFNQKTQYRLDCSTEHGKFSFIIIIKPKVGILNYLNFRL